MSTAQQERAKHLLNLLENQKQTLNPDELRFYIEQILNLLVEG